MLEELSIKDFALIENDYLEFNKGFTVLSGETGAGKSILIGALSFLLGGKADVQQIRNGKTEAVVSGTFYVKPCQVRDFDSEKIDENFEPENALEWLKLHNIEIENDRVLLRRFIKNTGKSGAWINSTPVTRTDLAEFSSYLIDIHGQHEHQSLMKITEHRKFLDRKAGIDSEVADFTKLYADLVRMRKELEQYSMSESDRLRKIDMAQFAVKEISDLKLKPEEDIQLEEEEARLTSFEKIYSDAENLTEGLTGTDNSIIGILKKLRRNSSHLAELDKSVSSLNERMDSVFYELSDIANEYENYKSNLIFDPSRLTEVQDRLSVIYGLKKKYASSVNAPLSEVFDYYTRAEKFLQDNADGHSVKDQLIAEIKHLEKKILIAAQDISEKRKNAAKILGQQIDQILANLGMSAHFEVSIQEKAGNEVEQKCGPYGKDNIEFLISSNPGNPLLPLAKIASGGELSRVMLALKTIFAQTDNVETLIFDEIDTGIGGEIAVAVGSHMKKIAENKQVFCITHLASIAVYAHNQIKIEKAVEGGITSSNVHVVEGDERIKEIARMLSGDSDNAQSMEHAKSMLIKYSGD